MFRDKQNVDNPSILGGKHVNKITHFFLTHTYFVTTLDNIKYEVL